MTKHCKPGSYASFTRAFRGVSTTTRTLSPSVHNGNLLRSAMLERSLAPAFPDEELAWNNGGGLWRVPSDPPQCHPSKWPAADPCKRQPCGNARAERRLGRPQRRRQDNAPEPHSRPARGRNGKTRAHQELARGRRGTGSSE